MEDLTLVIIIWQTFVESKLNLLVFMILTNGLMNPLVTMINLRFAVTFSLNLKSFELKFGSDLENSYQFKFVLKMSSQPGYDPKFPNQK